MKLTRAFLVAGLLAAPLWAAPDTNSPFQVGEKLIYQIYWGPFIAGKATLAVNGIEKVAGHDCYHLAATAETTGFADLLYHIDSRIESWLDTDEFCTRKYRQERKEGKSHRLDESLYNYAAGQLQVTNLLNGKARTFPLTNAVQDMLSALYFVRTKPLHLDVTETVPVMLGSNHYNVALQPDERKNLYFRPTGNVAALRLEPKPTLTVVASNGGRMWFWVSDDPRKLLLMITSEMKIGSAKFVLAKIKNASDPVTDKDTP